MGNCLTRARRACAVSEGGSAHRGRDVGSQLALPIPLPDLLTGPDSDKNQNDVENYRIMELR